MIAELPPLLRWMPESASRNAAAVDGIYFLLLIISGLLVLLLVVLNVTFIIRYHHGSRAPRPPLKIAPWKIETLWISLTTLVFLGIFAAGAPLYIERSQAPRGTHDLHVTARQWMWDVRQPNGRREFNTLHVPLGVPIRLLLESEDVIHSLYVPAFRLKQDVVPGKQVSLWFEPTRTGEYHLFCAEFCGTQHADMTGRVIVQSSADYQAWLDSGRPGETLVARGRHLFTRHGCAGCHAPGSRIHAPQLEGLYGRRVPLDDGTFATVDDRYLRDSILQPRREIAAGYEPVMPSYEGQLSDADLLDLLAYLKTLTDPTASVPPPAPVRLPGP